MDFRSTQVETWLALFNAVDYVSRHATVRFARRSTEVWGITEDRMVCVASHMATGDGTTCDIADASLDHVCIAFDAAECLARFREAGAAHGPHAVRGFGITLDAPVSSVTLRSAKLAFSFAGDEPTGRIVTYRVMLLPEVANDDVAPHELRGHAGSVHASMPMRSLTSLINRCYGDGQFRNTAIAFHPHYRRGRDNDDPAAHLLLLATDAQKTVDDATRQPRAFALDLEPGVSVSCPPAIDAASPVWDTEHTLYDASWDCTLLWRCLNGAAAIFGEDARVAIRVLPVLTITTKLPAHDAEVSYHIAPALRFKGDEDDDDEEDEEEEDEDEDDEDDEDDELDSDWNSDWDPNWDDLHNDLMVEQ